MNEDTAKYVRDKNRSLRETNNVSARDLSLSLGLGHAYISQVESGGHLPSIEVLGYICDYFKISLSEFFDIGNKNPDLLNKIIEEMKSLNTNTLESLYDITTKLNKNK